MEVVLLSIVNDTPTSRLD